MPIKDRWNRMVRKSVSSSSSSTAGRTEQATSNSSSAADDKDIKSSGRLAKTLTFRSSHKEPDSNTFDIKTKKKKKAKPATPAPPRHPSERPLTEANLQHQEILGAFSMKFGRRKASGAGRTSFSGISPGNSRQASQDATAYAQHRPSHGHPDRRVSSFANDVPREGPEDL